MSPTVHGRQDLVITAHPSLLDAGERAHEIRVWAPEAPALLDYARVFLLNKWHIAGSAIVCCALAALVLSQISPTYRATASLFIEGNRPQPVNSGAEVYTGVSPEAIYLQTQVEVLKSRELALRVIRQLELATHPEFDPHQRPLMPWQRWLNEGAPGLARLVVPQPPADLSEDALEAVVLGRFAAALRIQHLRNSQLVRIFFEAGDPVLAARITNAIVDAYIAADREMRLQTTRNAGEWINSRLSELREKLDGSEKALQSYREREGLFDAKGTTSSGVGRQLDEMITRLAEARTRRAEMESALREINTATGGGHDSAPAVVRNPAVQRAREREQEAQKRLSEAASVYGSAHPRYRVAEDDLRAARASTQAQIQSVVTSVSKEVNATRATEQSIAMALAQSKEAIQDLNRKEIQLAVLERDAAANRKVYEDFLFRLRETNVSIEPERASARFIDRAVAPADPFRPNKSLGLVMGAGAGLLLGAAFALLRKRLNNTVKKLAEVETELHQPLLGALPRLRGQARENAPEAFLSRRDPVYAESIRTIGTGVRLASTEQGSKVIAITSPVQEEGKSSVSMSLGLSLATSQRTLLIEADLRRPSIAQRCRTETQDRKGLVELVTGAAEFDACVFKVSGTNLDVVMAGELPVNPLDLLGSPRFAALLASLREQYDVVIIDCPPLEIVSDALVIGKIVTGVIYVVRGSHTPIPLARAGLKRLESASIPILGVVLNQHDFRAAERYYGEYSGYGRYGYGYGYGYAAHRAESNASR